MAESSPIHVNEANEAELQNLQYIGPKRAERILAWRADVGPITNSITFAQVAGISAAQAARIEDSVRFSAPATSPRLAGAYASGVALFALTTSLVTGGTLALVATGTALCAVCMSTLCDAGKLPAQHQPATRTGLRYATSASVGVLIAAWLTAFSAPGLFVLLSAWIAATILGPAAAFMLFQRHALAPTFVQRATYCYRETPAISLALAGGLVVGSGETAIAALFAVWSAAVAGVNTRERMDPVGGFAAALGTVQRAEFERLRTAGMLLLPRDDLGATLARTLRLIAAGVAAAGMALVLGALIL